MLAVDLDEKGCCVNGLVAQDVLLSRGMSSPNGLNTTIASPNSLNTSTQPVSGSNHFPVYPRGNIDRDIGVGTPSTCLGPCRGNQKKQILSSNADLDKSDKEEERRQKLRERKRIQRLNQDFAEKERLRARGRIKALRQDPVFRQQERQRDKERRRKARLMNQSQRLNEKERDKLHKSFMRSLENGRSNTYTMTMTLGDTDTGADH